MSLFETLAYDEYDTPFESIDDVARFILNPENCSPMYKALRSLIYRHAITTSVLEWSGNAIGIVSGLPEARDLFVDVLPPIAWRIAARILDRAVAIMRGAA